MLLLRGAQTPGRAEAAHRALALVPLARRRRGDARSASPTTGFVQQPRTPARAEGSALDRSCSRRSTVGAAPARPQPVRGRVRRGRRRRPTPAPTEEPEPQPLAQPHSLEVRNPATGEVVRSVAVTEEGEVAQKVARAPRRAAGVGRASVRRAGRGAPGVPRSARSRGRGVRAAHDERDGQADPAVAQRGPRRARAHRLEHRARRRRSSRRAPSRAPTALEERITYEPVGVVAHVSAWNYPYFVGLQLDRPRAARRQRGAATSRRSTRRSPGCASSTSCTAPGVPVDVVHAIVGGGATGAALVEADVDMVCFTGSYATGRRVAARRRRPLGPGAARARRQGRRVRVRRRRHRRRRARDRRGRVLQRRAVVQRDRARVRARGDLGRVRRARSSTWSARTASAIPTDDATDVGPLARAEQLDVLDAQLADAVQRGAQGAVRRRPHRAARQLVRADGAGRRARRPPRSCATRASAR